MDGCSCPQPDTTGCSNCHYISFRHNVVCAGRNNVPAAKKRRLCQFGPRDCSFCSIVTHTFLRRLEVTRRDDLMESVREGWKYQSLEGEFSMSEGIIPWDSTDSGNHETSTFVGVRYIEQIWGDSGGESPLGSAYFHVSWVSTKNTLSSIRPMVGPSVDWSILNKWIHECEHNHSELCQSSSTSRGLSRPARVLDVYNNCVVDLPPVDEYLTLSYVWGYAALSKKILIATTSNYSSLQEPGSLSERELPKTIEGAMEVCRKIGHQYLWVDSLCIIQNDLKDVKEQIARMSDIYSGSFLTIVAASGDNADAGLSGVLNGVPREPQQVARFDGLEMIEVLPLFGDVLKYSSWMSRAWTQQEWLLSHRCLYFTNFQAYFQCRTALRNEDVWVMQSTNSDGPPEKFDGDGNIPTYFPERSNLPWPRFRDLLEDYTNRHLSYSNDIFNACTGLYHYVYGSQNKRLIFGAPEADFCDALRWYSNGYTVRVPENSDFVIPSWSWGSTKACMVWFRGNGWKSGETSNEGPMTISLVKFAVCLGEDPGWTMLEISDRDEMTMTAVEKKLEFPDPLSQPIPVPGRLCFRTQTAMFRLCGEIGYLQLDRGGLKLEIEHDEKYKMASIVVSLDWALKYSFKRCESRCYRKDHKIFPSNTRENAKKLYKRGWNQCGHYMRTRPFKFALLSAVDIPRHWTISTLEKYVNGKDQSVTEDVGSYLGNLKPDNFYQRPGDFKDLHVMLIEENKNKDAVRRVGVTNLRMDDWLKSKPAMEDIVLE